MRVSELFGKTIVLQSGEVVAAEAWITASAWQALSAGLSQIVRTADSRSLTRRAGTPNFHVGFTLEQQLVLDDEGLSPRH